MAASTLETARQLVAAGYNPLPTKTGFKRPNLHDWKKFQTQRTINMVEGWWGIGSGNTGIWVACGAISRLVVLDIDSPAADRFWRSQPGMNEWMNATCSVKTAKGHHYWGRVAEGVAVQTWKVHQGEIGFDVQGEGVGVMCPPSPHPDGGTYEWVRNPTHIKDAPSLLLDGGSAIEAALAEGMTTGANGDTSGGKEAPDLGIGKGRSMLTSLLDASPAEGGRNEWLAKVVGHLVKDDPFHFQDAYLSMAHRLNRSLDDPLPTEEVDKTALHRWDQERTKYFDQGSCTDDNGYLIGIGVALMSEWASGTGKERQSGLARWADFDIKVLRTLNDDRTVSYLVGLTNRHGTTEHELPGKTLGNVQAMTAWLTQRQGTILPPRGDQGGTNSIARLARYVTAQDAPTSRLVHALGWDSHVQGFVTHEGVIRAGSSAAEPFDDVMPSQHLRNWANYRYGFDGTRQDAIAVLREVMTFHDETVCAVYGAWWAACFIKAQLIEAGAALFPFMAIEAGSESGKTRGFFALMQQLAGNAAGHGAFTKATFRDSVSAHRNGAVWLDDVADTKELDEIIRQSTSEGSQTKKGEDRHTNESVRLVAPIVISSEGMEVLNTEKAMSDRAVKLVVPSPVGRRSLHNPDRPQWDDVEDLEHQYIDNGLSIVAGHLVSEFLGRHRMANLLRELRPQDGRHGDKLAIIRVGARVLADVLSDPRQTELVDAWCSTQATIPGDNYLTMTVLPGLLRKTLMPTSSRNYQPVFVTDGIVWYAVKHCSSAWKELNRHDAREQQLGSESALMKQLTAIVNGGTRRFDVRGTAVKAYQQRDQWRFHSLPLALSALVIERAGWETLLGGTESTDRLL